MRAREGGSSSQHLRGADGVAGVGPATAAGVLAFAYQQPGVYLETNVRAVFLHDLFPDEEKVPDRVLRPLVADTLPACSGSRRLDRPS